MAWRSGRRAPSWFKKIGPVSRSPMSRSSARAVQGIEPANPLAQVETVGLQSGAGVPGQEPGDRPVDLLPGWVDVDEHDPSPNRGEHSDHDPPAQRHRQRKEQQAAPGPQR